MASFNWRVHGTCSQNIGDENSRRRRGESDIVFEPIYDADMSSSEVRRFASGGAVVTVSTEQGSIAIQSQSSLPMTIPSFGVCWCYPTCFAFGIPVSVAL